MPLEDDLLSGVQVDARTIPLVPPLRRAPLGLLL
jgi:hypothetical protein